MTRLQAITLRSIRAAILECVERLEATVGDLGEPLDTATAKVAVSIREAVGEFTDAILIAEKDFHSRVGRMP